MLELFELNHPRVHIVVHDIVIHTKLRGLLLQTLQTSSVTAREALVELRDAEMPPSTRRPASCRSSCASMRQRRAEPRALRAYEWHGDRSRAQGGGTITSRTLRIRDGFRVDRAGRIDAPPESDVDGLTLAGRPFGMERTCSGHLADERRRAGSSTARPAGQSIGWNIAAQLQQPQRATATAVLTRPGRALEHRRPRRRRSFALDPWLAEAAVLAAQRRAGCAGQSDRIGIAGNVGIPELDSKDLTIEASGNYAKRVLTIAAADIALNDSPAKLHAQGTRDVRWRVADARSRRSVAEPAVAAARQAVVTSATGEGTLRGPLPYDFTTTAQVDGPNLPPHRARRAACCRRRSSRVAQYDVKRSMAP